MGKPEPRLIGSCTDKQVSNSLWIGTTPSMSDSALKQHIRSIHSSTSTYGWQPAQLHFIPSTINFKL